MSSVTSPLGEGPVSVWTPPPLKAARPGEEAAKEGPHYRLLRGSSGGANGGASGGDRRGGGAEGGGPPRAPPPH